MAAGGGRRWAVTRPPRRGGETGGRIHIAVARKTGATPPGATPNMAAALPRLSLPLPREGGVSPRESSARWRAADMEPGGGGGVGGAGPLPGNNKARGGAAPPGKARDLGRPPRKDSEVSAAAAGPGSAGRDRGGGRRPSRARPRSSSSAVGPGPARAVPASAGSAVRFSPDPRGASRCVWGSAIPRAGAGPAAPSPGAGASVPVSPGPVLLPQSLGLRRQQRGCAGRYLLCGAEGPFSDRPVRYRPCPELTWVGTGLGSVPISRSSISSPSLGRFDRSAA